MSRQAINLNKSGFLCGRDCPQNLKRNIAAELRVPISENIGNTWEFHPIEAKQKKQVFAWILARVERKLEGWKERLISKAGKEVLIKAVIQAIPQYAMSIFNIPTSICQAMEKRIASFWWKQNSDRRGVHWKKWEDLKMRKDCGGLGFKDLVDLNKAMLGKQAWRMLQLPNALWYKVLKSIYYLRSDLWTTKKGIQPSWGWQSLLVGRDTIETATKWEAGDGRSIRIREDVWLPSGRLIGPANRNDPTMVADLINHEAKVWNESRVTELFDENVVKEILAQPLSLHTNSDKLIWTANSSGSYTVKSCYSILHNRD